MPGRPRKSPLFPVALSVESAAIALGVPARWLRAQVHAGLVPAFDMGGRRIRVLVADLVEFVRERPRIFRKRSPKQ